MNKQVAVDLDGSGNHVLAELVSTKSGWATINVEIEGVVQTRKVRVKQIALDAEDNAPEEVLEEILTDEDEDLDEDGNVRRGDVFPAGVRETYLKGKTASGKAFIDCGDEIAEQLRDMSLEQVAHVAEQVLGQLTAAGWLALYTTDREAEGKKALNPGMVRMNLGNRIRAAIKLQEKEAQEAEEAEGGEEEGGDEEAGE
jgi:hypothetical protein